MTAEEAADLAEQALREADSGNTLIALIHLEKILKERKSPLLTSYFAYCLARERNEYHRALRLCKQAIESALPIPVLYLNLGRIFLTAGHKRQALNAFHHGLKLGRHPLIVAEIKQLGIRKKPVIPMLPRNNTCNIYLGRLLTRLTLR